MMSQKEKRGFPYTQVLILLLIMAIVFLGRKTLEESGKAVLDPQDQETAVTEPPKKPNLEDTLQKQEETEQEIPKPKFSDDINIDIITRHGLPSLTRMDEQDREKYVDSLQVMKKFQALNLDEDSVLHPELNYKETKKSIQQAIHKLVKENKNREEILFRGDNGLELQECINQNRGKVIEIKSEIIRLDQGIDLPGDTSIHGNHAVFDCRGTTYALKGEQVSNVSVEDVELTGDSDYGMVFSGVSNGLVSDCRIHGMKEKPLVIEDSSKNISVRDNRMYENMSGGIYISDGTSYVDISGNDVSENKGTSNWMAGIVMTNCNSESILDIWERFDVNHHFPSRKNLLSDSECPNHIIVEKNTVCGNQASGIYSDGAYISYVLNNFVVKNDKEGICLDYGTIGLYVVDNTYEENGFRRRQSDKDLEMDFVLEAGREEDGSSKSKLPAVSIDNAAYNIIETNIIKDNGGGGVKMVRTGIRNLVIENVIKDNNRENDTHHFFGIEIGSALGDTDDTDMDFTPGYENIICRNTISGKYWSGVFIGENGFVNDVFDNTIMEPEYFAVESISTMFNSIVNNVSNMPVRSEYHEE